MNGVDTTVLVRFVVEDPEAPAQCRAARDLFAGFTPSQPGYVSLTVLVEFCWVLDRGYHTGRGQITAAVAALLHHPELNIEHADRVDAALREATGANRDLPDALISVAGREAGCVTTVTFDKRATALPGMSLLPWT